MKTGEVIKTMRKAAKMSKADLSRALETTRAAIDYMERGDGCSTSRLKSVAKACGFKMEMTFKFEGLKDETIIVA